MNSSLYPRNSFSEQEIKDLSAAMKVGILGTVNPQGLPHLTLITTLMASSPQVVVWGQFMEGSSKKHVLTNPKTGFMVMGLDKNFWRGFADYSHSETSGKDYAYYNNTPLFRYNAYFGVHRVHYMDLIAHTGKHPLPMQRIIPAAVMTMVAKTLSAKPQKTPVLNPWTQAFFNKIDNLKFLGYVNAEGYPVIIPLIRRRRSTASISSIHWARLVMSWRKFHRTLQWQCSAWRSAWKMCWCAALTRESSALPA